MGARTHPGWWWRVGRIAGTVALVGSAVMGAGVAVRGWFDTRDATDRTIASLHSTREELAHTEDELAKARTELETAQTTLEGELATLDLREGERDAAQAALDAAATLLTEVEAQLDAASTDLVDQTARLDALVRCLIGVSGALNQASVGDVAGMSATFGGIETTCTEAGAVL